jgi:hypothetical protein
MTKVKAIALALFVAGFCASYAFAGNGHGHGKGNDAAVSTSSTSDTTTTTATHGKGKGKAKDATACKPNVSFILNGTFVAAGADGASFTMNVTHTNHHAKGLSSPATVSTDAKTAIRRNGKKVTVADLVAGDRLNVQARGCKNPPAGTVQTLVAKRVVAHPAASTDGDTTTTTETESETNP